MHELIGLLLSLGVSFILLMIGLIFGGAAERRHFRMLEHREADMQHVMTTQVRVFLLPHPQGKPPRLVVAETVIASDYLKSFLGGLRNIFGGNVKSFETLLERGRREVTVKLQEQATELGYNAICNVRLTAANVGGSGGGAIAMAAVLGWATAYDASSPESPQPPVSHGDVTTTLTAPAPKRRNAVRAITTSPWNMSLSSGFSRLCQMRVNGRQVAKAIRWVRPLPRKTGSTRVSGTSLPSVPLCRGPNPAMRPPMPAG